MPKTLVIIGAGAEQVPAYQKAKARGFTVVGTDLNPSAPAFAFADHQVIASTRDAEATLEAIRTFSQSHPVDGVMTIANDVPYTVALVADGLNLRGISLDAACCASHKLVMKDRFKAHGVACPWYQGIDTLEELRHIIASQPETRFVIKPIDGRGARGVLLLDSNSDLAWAFEESRRWGDSGQLMLERFVPGLQLSTESFILDGACYTPAIAERNYARLEQFAPYIIEDGGTIPPPIDVSLKQAIDELVLAGANAMGITRGIVKGDIVVDAATGKPLIIELAARLSGGWFATHQIPEASGVDLVNAVISEALGEPVTPESLTPTKSRATVIRYWFPEPGRIVDIQGEAQLKQLPGLMAYGFFRKPGDEQPEIKSHPDRFGYVIVSADNRDVALARVEEALSLVTVKTEPQATSAV